VSEWHEVSIAAIAKTVAGGPFGSSLGRKDYVAHGVPVIRGAQLSSDARFRLDDFVFVTEEKAERHRGNLAYPGDVIVTQRGTLGQVGMIPWDCPYPRLLLSQSQMKVTLDRSFADPHFLFYALAEPGNRQRLIEHAITAGVPHINLATLREFMVKVPNLQTQQACVSVLSAIDDLIENNRRRIALLEQMAQAIYREWFVRFRYPGHEDDELVDSPLGPIPAGWQLSPLFDEAEVSFGFPLKSQGFGPSGALPVIRIRDIPKGSTSTHTDEFPGERYVVDTGDSLIGMDGDFHMSRWPAGRALLNQRVARVRPTGCLGAEALHWALQAPIKEWNQRIVGTTVAHLGKRHLEEIELVVPLRDKAQELNRTLDSLGVLSLELRRLVVLLESLRDLLLPKLVTGAIDVSHLDLDAMLADESAG